MGGALGGGGLLEEEGDGFVEDSMFIDLPEISPEGSLHDPKDGIWCGGLSQKGFYPGKDHTNQDAMTVTIRNQNSPGQHLFVVLDGHGSEGHHVAQFVERRLPYTINRLAKSNKNQVGVLQQSYNIVNTMLRNEPGIDDTLSGTTCVTAWFQGSLVHVANCGDSRAVLGTTDQKGKVIAVDLSHDQTPFREDERRRVTQAGARIMTSREKDGEVVHKSPEDYTADDPPRCYLQKHKLPGTAFTRSIGDAIAERIGVIPTPEVMVHRLTDADRFLILASDGVWEFISSQEAVDLVAECENPYEAAYKLIEVAWRLWLEFDTRTDDITVVVIFTHVIRKQDKSSQPRGSSATASRSKSKVQHPWAAAVARAPHVNGSLCPRRRDSVSSWMSLDAEVIDGMTAADIK